MRGAGPRPPTLAGGHGAAPLAAAPALGAGRAPQHVAAAAGEVHHVVEVELGATREPMGGVPGVAARDGCGGRGDRPRHRRDARAPRSPAGQRTSRRRASCRAGASAAGGGRWEATVGRARGCRPNCGR